MKNISILTSLSVLFCALLFVSCDNMTVTTGDGSYKVTGNGKQTSQNRDTGPFNQIEIEGVFNVYLSQGDKESVKVETDENIQPLILTTVKDNVLSVKMKDSTSINKMKKINIFISLVDISKLSSTGVGSLKCSQKLNLKNLEFMSKGVGATDLKLSVEKLTVHSEIVGALMLSGDAKEVVINHNGVGIIQAFDLKAEKLSLRSDGIGSAEVYASKELNINSSGLGGVKYKGNPEVKNIKNEGLCKIEEEK
ncbi:MAG: head GIN domain-containing protein [Bacteroidia bacterium]